ncbi:MAG: ATP synthase F1 subunit gamma [Verrucomicrobia bacterium]|nr:ATP synthase F1 subunit gamma [Verrucomicrobiota bacterium]
MPSYRESSKKLQSLRSMRRVTRTMKLVAAGHLRRAQTALVQADRVFADLRTMAAHLGPAAGLPCTLAHPGADGGNALLLVISANRGLCGAFNNNIVRAAGAWAESGRGRWRNIRASFVGRKAHAALRDRIEVRRLHEDLASRPEFADALRIGLELCALFQAGMYSEIHIAYTRFQSAMTCEAVVERLLPADPAALGGGQAPAPDGPAVLLEPDPQTLAERLMAKAIHLTIYRAMCHSHASECGSRMVAMDGATNNIDKLATRTTLLRNTARQAAITRELVEIVAGAESLKGSG